MCVVRLSQELFPDFFKAFLTLKQRREETQALQMHERATYLAFTVNIFQVCLLPVCSIVHLSQHCKPCSSFVSYAQQKHWP